MSSNNDKSFLIPWGSESICMWCKKDGKCLLFKKEDLSENEKKLIKVFWGAVRQSQIIRCPINEFEPDMEKNVHITNGRKLKLRYGC